MFLLLSFGLVLAAAALFVVGVVGGELTAIYLSMAASGGAGLALMVSARLGREHRPAAPDGPAPLAAEPAREPAAVGAGQAVGEAMAPATTVAGTSRSASSAPAPPADGSVEDDWDGDLGGEFPIADYDDLGEDEVVPLLALLDEAELDLVEERERLTKRRRGVLDRIDEVRAGTAGRDRVGAPGGGDGGSGSGEAAGSDGAGASGAGDGGSGSGEAAGSDRAGASGAGDGGSGSGEAADLIDLRGPAAAGGGPAAATPSAGEPGDVPAAVATTAAAGDDPAPAPAAAGSGQDAPAAPRRPAPAAPRAYGRARPAVPRRSTPPAPAPAADGTAEPAPVAATGERGHPLGDLAAMRPNEVVAALAALDVDQLAAVRADEEAGPRRRTVLAAVDRRLSRLRGQGPGTTA